MQTDTDVVFVTGPDLVTLPCGCQVDHYTGSCWTPCPAIRGTYGCASYLISTGRRSELLTRCEARIQAHVAAQRVAVDAEQGALC